MNDPVVVTAADLLQALDLLMDALNQSCRRDDGTVDSYAFSAYSDALRFLSDHGRFRIEHDYGRRVVGRWTHE
jgi:hypothetical protein